MKRPRALLNLAACGLFAATLGLPSLALADFKDGKHSSDGPGRGVGHNPGPINPDHLPPQAPAKGVRDGKGTDNRKGVGHAGPGVVPELDPAGARSAVLLLLGSTLVVLGRREGRRTV